MFMRPLSPARAGLADHEQGFFFERWYFMRKFLAFSLAFVVVFNCVCLDAFAVSGEDITDYGNWYEEMKAAGDAVAYGTLKVAYNDLINKPLSGFATVIATYDSSATVVGAGMRYFASLIKAGNTPEQALQLMQQDITENNGTISLTGDGAMYIENYYADGSKNGTGGSLSNLGYRDFYIATANYLNPSLFPNANLYNVCKNIIKNNPDYYVTIISYYGGVYRIFATNQAPLGGVLDRQYWGLDKPAVNLYTDNWNQDFVVDADGNKALITVKTTYNPYQPDSALSYTYLNESGEWVIISEDDALKLNLDSILVPDATASQVDSASWYTVQFSHLYGSPSALLYDYVSDGQMLGVNMQSRAPVLFHGSGTQLTSIPVFTTLNELKKGTLGKSTATVLPSYTGNGINGAITDSQVTQARDIITNYYQDGTPQGSGGNNNNNNDNNGTGSNWLDKLLQGLGSLGQSVLAILGELLSIIKPSKPSDKASRTTVQNSCGKNGKTADSISIKPVCKMSKTP